VLGGEFTLDDLRAATFCLAPSGWGWGWRITLALLTQCVPVIIQPNVSQPFEDLIPYERCVYMPIYTYLVHLSIYIYT